MGNEQAIEQVKKNITNIKRMLTSGRKSSRQVVTLKLQLTTYKAELQQLQENQFNSLTVNEFIRWTENQFSDWLPPQKDRVRKFVVQTLSDLYQFKGMDRNIEFSVLKDKYDIDKHLETFFQ